MSATDFGQGAPALPIGLLYVSCSLNSVKGVIDGTRVVFFCCLVFFVVGSLKDEPGRPVSE